MAPPRRATARAATLPARRPLPTLRRYLPSPRSLLVGIALAALAVGGYVAARETSIFSVREVQVVGGSPQLQDEARKALRPELGRSLVSVRGDELERRLVTVAGVLSVRFDRRFPHTLRVVVTPERPVLLLRRGKDAFVVSARGRVLSAVRDPSAVALPRVWVPKDTTVEVNAMLAAKSGGIAAGALAPLVGSSFPAAVRAVRSKAAELTLVLDSGVELRLGDNGDLRLKLAVARQLLLVDGASTGARYIDVSVPERPVVGFGNSQVEGAA